ncbi:MAG: substrate-binding domain-containing protein [Sedimentisphaerales bacterium]|nr:substrate-binding domain-containing protein [Sedimentisphaerales bacterium]
MKNVIWIVLFLLIAGIFIGIGISRKGSTENSGEIVIGVIPKETTSAYWNGVYKGALQAGKEENVKILWNGPEIETDRERQIQIVQDMAAQQVAGIVLAPNDRKALVPIVEQLYDKNIPCVIIDSGIDTEKYLSYMATDNYNGGAMAARRIGKLTGGKGNVILLAWIPNAGSTDARQNGFRDTLAKEFPDVKIVDSQYPNPATVTRSREITEDMLMKNPDVQAIFCCNATDSAGALQALRGPGLAQRGIKLIGFDAWDSLVEGLAAGELDSLVLQNPYKMGYEGVKAIMKKRRGREIPKKVDTGVELVTKDRMEEPLIKQLLETR